MTRLLFLRIWLSLNIDGKNHSWCWDKRYENYIDLPTFTDDFILQCVRENLKVDVSAMIDTVDNFGNPEFETHIERKYDLKLKPERMSKADINAVLLAIYGVKTKKVNPEKVTWDLLEEDHRDKDAINPEEYGLPKEMIDYLGDKGNLFKSITGGLEGPSMIELRAASNLKLIDVAFYASDEHIKITHEFYNQDINKANEDERYHFKAVDLIRENDLYQSEGLLIWIPELKKFGSYDPEHSNLIVFPDAAAKDIIKNYGKYIAAQWSYGPDYIVRCGNIYDFYEPWNYFRFGPPTPTFKDVNLKISIIGALHELGYYTDEAARIQNENADWEHSHKPIPAVLAYYTDLEIDQNYLDEIEGLYPDGGDLCYQYLFNEWDGEDTQFDITSLEGIEYLRNLKNFEPISMITDDGLDYSPLLLCKNLEKIAPEYIDEDENGILQQLKDKGVKTDDRQSNWNDEDTASEPAPFDADNPKILIFYLSEYEKRFGRLEMNISDTVYNCPFYYHDYLFKKVSPEFVDEKGISDEECAVGFAILDKIWLENIAHSSAIYRSSAFYKEPIPEEDTHFVQASYGFVPGYDLAKAIETVTQQNFEVIRWDEFWDIDKNWDGDINEKVSQDTSQQPIASGKEANDVPKEPTVSRKIVEDTTGLYYAHATDLDGNAIEIPVSEDGAVQIPSTQKIKSLKTNALKVFCRNNELEVLEAHYALSVGCNKNKIRTLWLENAESVHCAENQLTELHAPKATHVRCQMNQLTQLKLESVVELECRINSGLVFLHAPNLRKIDCDIKKPDSEEYFTSVKEIEIELKNEFNPNDSATYDIDALEVEILLDLHKELLVENLSFSIALQQVDFYSYENESGADAFGIYLMRPNVEFGQQEKILAQAPKLPISIAQPTQINFSIPIVSFPDQHRNLLDVIKQAPDRILEYEKELVLQITFYLNPDKLNEKNYYRMFTLKNPFYKTGTE